MLPRRRRQIKRTPRFALVVQTDIEGKRVDMIEILR